MEPIIEEVQDNKESKVNIKSEILNAKGRSVAKVVSEYVNNNNIDMVIMGGTKLARWKYLFMGGNVTAGIIDKAKCHVLMIR
jgi:nucleotide-binding universal stress UspA family protein